MTLELTRDNDRVPIPVPPLSNAAVVDEKGNDPEGDQRGKDPRELPHLHLDLDSSRLGLRYILSFSTCRI